MGGTVPSAVAAVLIGLAAVAASDLRAQAPAPVGGEFQVNVYTFGSQNVHAVGMDDDGDFVVAWESRQDGSEYGVFARRFNSMGVGQGPFFQVNTYTPDYQERPSIDLDSDGDFVIAWESSLQDGSSFGIFARRFSSSGAPLTAEVPVNSTTADVQLTPAVAADADGDFVVAWESNLQDGSSWGIFARRFNSTGNPLAGEFRANSFTANGQRSPTIGVDSDGDFVVAWISLNQDGSGNGIFGQRFSSAGAMLGPEFQINVTFSGEQTNPSVGVDSDGDFVVVWQDEVGALAYDVRGRRFNSSGTPQGGEFQLSSDPGSGDQMAPRVAAEADGDFVVAWHGDAAGGGDGILMRRFKASGAPQNLDTQVNTTTGGVQTLAAVATDFDGDFLVTWNGMDGADFGVFGRRYDVSPLIDVDGDGLYLPLTDGLLLLRFAFGFTGNTLIIGAVGPGCTRCDALSITAYLEGLV